MGHESVPVPSVMSTATGRRQTLPCAIALSLDLTVSEPGTYFSSPLSALNSSQTERLYFTAPVLLHSY